MIGMSNPMQAMSTGNRGATGTSLVGKGSGDVIPKGYNQGQLQQFTPEQLSLFKQMFGQVGQDSFLSKLAGGDEQTFQDIEAPQHRQFGEYLGNAGSRFAGMGSTGNIKSSGFQNGITAASSGFAQDLASKRQGLQRQAMGDLFNMQNTLLGQRPYEKFVTKEPAKQPSFWEELLTKSIPGVIQQGAGAGLKYLGL